MRDVKPQSSNQGQEDPDQKAQAPASSARPERHLEHGRGEPQERQVDAMRRKLRELTFLHETSQVLTATLDLDSVLKSLIAQVRDYFRVDAVSVALLDEEREELIFRVAVGEASDEVVGMRLALNQGIASWVVQTGKSLLVPDVRADERFYSDVDDKTGFRTRTILAVPIKSMEGKDRAIGVIEALNPPSGAFDEEAQRLLKAVADLAAAAIRNAELYKRVREAEQRYESLFSESTAPIVVMDLTGHILNLNRQAAELLGRPVEQLLGTRRYDLLGETPADCDNILEQLRQGQRVSLEKTISSEEEHRVLETHMTSIDYGGHEAIQWIGHDITEQVELEHLRDDMTHMIIHDLRNPLGNIVSSLHMMYTAFREQDETLPVMDVLKVAMRSSKKLNQLIDSLLDLRQLEEGTATLNKTLVRPQAIAQDALELTKPLAIKKQQELNLHLPPDLPNLPADKGMITRVLTNILDNAVKFTPMEGRITLNIEQAEHEMIFEVSDTGPGIPAEFQNRIFDRFARLEDAEGTKGTGLGLAFCKLAVEEHGGRIWVESEEGEGSRFTFALPLEER